MGLRVTGDQSHPVRPLSRTGKFTHAKDAKAETGDAGIRGLTGDQSHPVRIYFAPNAPRLCFEQLKDRESILRDARIG